MARRTPKRTALLVAAMFKRGKKNRARISTKTLSLLSKCPDQPESGFVEVLKQELLNVYDIAFFERPKGGYIGLKLSDLDTSASLKASDTLGSLHLRVLTSHDMRMLKNEVFGLPRGVIDQEADTTQEPSVLPCFEGNLYYDSEEYVDSDLIYVKRLVVREDNVAFDMTTSWNGRTDKLNFTGTAHLDRAIGRYVSERFNVSCEHDKTYSAAASLELELNPGSQGIDVSGKLKFVGVDYQFSGELTRTFPKDKTVPTLFPIKKADE